MRHIQTHFQEFLQMLRWKNSIITILMLFYYRYKKIKKTIPLTLRGNDIWIRTTTPDINVALDTLGSELEPLKYFLDSNRKGLIIDAGGYIGTSAIKLASLFPECNIVTVEPSSENFSILKKNIIGKSKINAINCALHRIETIATLRDRQTGEWGFSIIAENSDRHRSNIIEDVKTTTINKILEASDSDRIYILKMDVEGSEKMILESSSEWIDKVDILVIELHERIVAGTEVIFRNATKGRINIKFGGEKYFSLYTKIFINN